LYTKVNISVQYSQDGDMRYNVEAMKAEGIPNPGSCINVLLVSQNQKALEYHYIIS